MFSDHPAIRVHNPGKKHTIGRSQENYLTLRDAIVNSVKAPQFKQFNRGLPMPKGSGRQRMFPLMWNRARL